MSKKLKYSDKFGDSNDEYETILHINVENFIESLKDKIQAENVISKLEILKQEAENKLKIIRKQEFIEKIKIQNTKIDGKNNSNSIEKKDIISFYKSQLKLITYKDDTRPEDYHRLTRSTNAKFEFTNKKIKIELDITYINDEGMENVSGCLSFNDSEDLWFVEEYEEDGEWSKENSKILIKLSEFEEIEKDVSDIEKNFIKNLIMAIVSFLIEKYGKSDEYGLGFGISEDFLEKILK